MVGSVDVARYMEVSKPHVFYASIFLGGCCLPTDAILYLHVIGLDVDVNVYVYDCYLM